MNYALASRPDEIIIDHNVGRSYCGVSTRPLMSVKCMFDGRARYVADGRRAFVLDDSSYVILNHGNAYSVEKRSPTPVETFCVFFPERMSGAVARDILTDHAVLLEDVAEEGRRAFNLLEHRRPHGDAVTRRIVSMRRASASGRLSDAWLEEQLLFLMQAMLLSETSVRKRIAGLPRARSSTREELFRRVHRGRDYLHAHLDQPVSLMSAARAAAMSPYHFLRSFRTVFGTTPHAYLSAERLHRAGHLLQRTPYSVTEISAMAGFESLPSFVHGFRKQFGVTPSHYRRQTSNRR